jgi:hypothetical protein
MSPAVRYGCFFFAAPFFAPPFFLAFSSAGSAGGGGGQKSAGVVGFTFFQTSAGSQDIPAGAGCAGAGARLARPAAARPTVDNTARVIRFMGRFLLR